MKVLSMDPHWILIGLITGFMLSPLAEILIIKLSDIIDGYKRRKLYKKLDEQHAEWLKNRPIYFETEDEYNDWLKNKLNK